MWSPTLTIRGKNQWSRHLPQAVSQSEAIPDSEVVDGKNVRPAKPEHQHHLHGPAPDPAHLRQALYDFRVR